MEDDYCFRDRLLLFHELMWEQVKKFSSSLVGILYRQSLTNDVDSGCNNCIQKKRLNGGSYVKKNMKKIRQFCKHSPKSLKNDIRHTDKGSVRNILMINRSNLSISNLQNFALEMSVKKLVQKKLMLYRRQCDTDSCQKYYNVVPSEKVTNLSVEKFFLILQGIAVFLRDHATDYTLYWFIALASCALNLANVLPSSTGVKSYSSYIPSSSVTHQSATALRSHLSEEWFQVGITESNSDVAGDITLNKRVAESGPYNVQSRLSITDCETYELYNINSVFTLSDCEIDGAPNVKSELSPSDNGTDGAFNVKNEITKENHESILGIGKIVLKYPKLCKVKKSSSYQEKNIDSHGEVTERESLCRMPKPPAARSNVSGGSDVSHVWHRECRAFTPRHQEVRQNIESETKAGCPSGSNLETSGVLSRQEKPQSCSCIDCVAELRTLDLERLHSGWQSYLGLDMKFNPGRHMLWLRYLTAFPFDSHAPNSSEPDNLYHFMQYEAFRLSTFSWSRFPTILSIFVTCLAHYGFYYVSRLAEVLCFGCGSRYIGSDYASMENACLLSYEGKARLENSLETAHHPRCSRLESNKDLAVWVQGLDKQLSTECYTQYKSLIPFSLEDSFYLADTNENTEQHNPAEAHQTVPSAARYSKNLRNVAEDIPAQQVNSRSENSTEGGAVGGVAQTVDLSNASYPQFSSVNARRDSFKKWSPQHSHRPDDLVAAGFFFAGYADCVRCFFCGLGLKFWKPTDIPAYQHARFRPHCVYNRMYKGQEYIDRVQEDFMAEQRATSGATNHNAPGQVEQTVVSTAREAEQTAVSTARQVEQTVVSTPTENIAPQDPDHMNSEAALEALRNGWARDQVQQAVNHIVQEFGENCLEYDLLSDVLTNLNMDDVPGDNLPSSGGSTGSSSVSEASSNDADPTMLSSVHAPAIPALNVADGVRDLPVAPEIVREEATAATPASSSRVQQPVATPASSSRVQQPVATPASSSRVQQPAATSASSSRVQQPAAPSLDRREVFSTIEREHMLLIERTTCRVCRLQPVGCIYLPCGHVIACPTCAENASHCIFCHKQIIGTANIYLA